MHSTHFGLVPVLFRVYPAKHLEQLLNDEQTSQKRIRSHWIQLVRPDESRVNPGKQLEHLLEVKQI